jgi:hypothetical protein
MRRLFLWIPFCLAACDNTVGDQKPVGGTTDTEAEVQRYVRRAYLDLSGRPPSDADLNATTVRLRDAGNTAAVRASFVDERIATDDYAKVWVEELENGILGGNTLEQQYLFLCSIVKNGDNSCDTCTQTDPCKCACGILPTLDAERTDLMKATADFKSNMATSEIERRYAMAVGYFALSGTPEGRTIALFDDFLSRPAEPDEIENGRAMIVGAIFPGSPAGLMFHRHGSNYADMIDIIFDSEVYRESMVRRVFNRYLAREPSSLELAHFVTTLDATKPDQRGLVRSVLSSREYFEQ